MADFSQLSTHEKKIAGLKNDFLDEFSLEEEIFTIQNEILAPLRQAVGKKTKIKLRLGNHDIRWMRIAESNLKALGEMLKSMRANRSLELEDVLKLDKFGIQMSYRPVDVLYDQFTLTHGVKTNKMVAKQNLLRYGSGTSGHTHRMGTWTEVMHGKLQSWNESGCLRMIDNVEYLPIGDRPHWCHGFLELTINAERFFCSPHIIVKGQTDFHGQIFR